MTSSRARRNARIWITFVVISAVLGSGARAQDAAAPKPIAELNEQTWKMAEGLLPDEFLNRYKNGLRAAPLKPASGSLQQKRYPHL